MARPKNLASIGLLLISTINFLNFADRYVIGGVQELIKTDAAFPGGTRDVLGHLTDANLGELTGIFVIVFMLASPFTGWLGDRMPRKYLVSGGVGLWSLATIASGLAPSFGTLLLARACIGVGEAGYATVAPSLLADLFPPSSRGKALGVFNVVMPLGAAAGFAIGGWVGATHSWRHAFYVAGIPGFALALAFLFLPEPKRGIHDDPSERGEAMNPLQTVKTLLGNRALIFNIAGQVLLTFTVGGLASWMPSFFVRQLGLAQGQAGTYFGALIAGAGILGTVAGTLAGEYAEKRVRNGYFWVSGLGLVASVPFILILSRAPGLPLTLGATFFALFFVLFNSAPLYTALLNAVPANLRASAVAFTLLTTHLLGDASSSTLIGALSDATGSLSLAIAANAIPVLLGGGVLLWGAKTLVAGAPAQASGVGAS